MYLLLGYVSLAVQGLLWVLLFGFGAWLYYRFRLRTLLWLGAYLALSLLLGLIMPQMLGALLDSGSTPFHGSVGDFCWHMAYWDMLLRSVTWVVLALMILAEFTYWVARAVPALDLRPFGQLLMVRERAGMLGVALIALTLAGPLAAGILWLA